MCRYLIALCLLLLSSGASAWPLRIAGAPAPPAAWWEPAGIQCKQALHTRGGTFAFDQAECTTTYQPLRRTPLYETGREARTAKGNRIVPQHPTASTVAQAAPK